MNIDIVAVGRGRSRSIAQQGEPIQVAGVAPTWLHRATRSMQLDVAPDG